MSHKAKNLFLFLTLFLYVQSSTLNEPLQFLRNKFQVKIDTNPYYYFQHIRQDDGNLPCTSLDGPFCKPINNQSLVDYTEENISQEILDIKKSLKSDILRVVKDIDKRKASNEQSKQGIMPVVYYLNSSRLIFDEKMFYEPASKKQPNLYLIGLDGIEIYEKDMKESKYFNIFITQNPIVGIKYEFITKEKADIYFQPKFIGPLTQNEQKKQDQDFNLAFKDFYTPPERLLDKNVKKKEQQKLEKPQEESFEDSIKKGPSDIYLYTKEKPGLVYFSKPVSIKSLYLRQQNYQPNTNPIFEVKGYLNQELIYTSSAKNKEKFNSWVKLDILEENSFINYLEIPPNSNVDNILFEKYESFNTRENFYDALSKINTKGGNKLQRGQNIQEKTIHIKLNDLQNIFKQVEGNKKDINSDNIQKIFEDAAKNSNNNGDEDDKSIEIKIITKDIDLNNNIEDQLQDILGNIDINDMDIEGIDITDFDINDINLQDFDAFLDNLSEEDLKTIMEKTSEDMQNLLEYQAGISIKDLFEENFEVSNFSNINDFQSKKLNEIYTEDDFGEMGNKQLIDIEEQDIQNYKKNLTPEQLKKQEKKILFLETITSEEIKKEKERMNQFMQQLDNNFGKKVQKEQKQENQQQQQQTEKDGISIQTNQKNQQQQQKQQQSSTKQKKKQSEYENQSLEQIQDTLNKNLDNLNLDNLDLEQLQQQIKDLENLKNNFKLQKKQKMTQNQDQNLKKKEIKNDTQNNQKKSDL